LEADPTINAFIAIGEGNLEICKKILDDVPEIKLVLYSRSLGAQTLGNNAQHTHT